MTSDVAETEVYGGWMRMAACRSEIETECVVSWLDAEMDREDEIEADCFPRLIFPLTYTYTGVYMG